MLQEAEVELAKGRTTLDVVRKFGIAEQTYYRWRKEYGGLRVDQAKRLKEFQKENARLKKLVGEQALEQPQAHKRLSPGPEEIPLKSPDTDQDD